LTQIKCSEKVLFMRTFIITLILTVNFQFLSKADDISDFEKEGISVGDSLLKYYDKSSIEDLNKQFIQQVINFIKLKLNQMKVIMTV